MSEKKSNYRAPALEKGLAILELLAGAQGPVTASDISVAMNRTLSEIFRILQVLEELRYISRGERGYRLTSKLFMLGLSQPPMPNMQQIALPLMQALAAEIGQSCHLAVPSGSEMVVVLVVEAPGLLGFAVRVGYRRPLAESASGQVLLAYQPAETRQRMLESLDGKLSAARRKRWERELDALVERGHVSIDSPMHQGITDLSVPLLLHGSAIAALTVPYIGGAGVQQSPEVVLRLLSQAGERISRELEAEAPVGISA